VNAAAFYRAEVLIMGGDLAGKAIVPLVKGADGSLTATFLGEERRVSTTADTESLLDAIRFNGMYPWVSDAGDVARVGADKHAQDVLFETVIQEELARWVRFAEERLDGSKTVLYLMAGNDDPWSIEAAIPDGPHVWRCDDLIVTVGSHEMISSSYANPTPWHSHRELDEDALYKHMKRFAEQLSDPRTAIFNLHVPPYDSGLDQVVEIDETLAPVFKSGQPHVIPVGSTAVRDLIEEYQPVLALHGHIHEGRGETRIGRTLVLNPGSEYATGRVHGVIVTLAQDAVVGHQFVVG
jgi:Icc-related predicted phosphoesterase